MLRKNPHAIHSDYPEALQRILNAADARQGQQELSSWPLLRTGPTPLWNMPGLAGEFGIARVGIKDESARSTLGSFKVLGAPLALARLVRRLFPDADMAPADLFAGAHRAALAQTTVISATDGNHGRALAAAAQSLGCPCTIVLHAHVSSERDAAIAQFGAHIVRIAGNYDDSVQEASRLAEQNGWFVVSDTSYEGYEEIPRDVMQGYAAIAAEVLEQAGTQARPSATATHPSGTAGCPYTHVILQGGVGGLAAGMASYLWETFGVRRPTFIVVEPEQAACLFQSAVLGRAARATGSIDSVMAGLACGETSPLAWRILQPCIDYFMTVSDNAALAAMRRLAEGLHDDVPVVGGESGVAGLAALAALARDHALAARLGLDARSSVLLINTEGATAPALYRQIVGADAQAVQKRQQEWLARQR